MSASELLLWAMLITGCGWLFAALVGWIDNLIYPPLQPDPATAAASHAGRVTVLIPARNEAHNIGACVRAALDQSYPDVRVIVVDDQSTDGTGEILARIAATTPRLRVINGQALPEGWVGKGWALYQGHRVADGDWIVLLDADVRLERDALATVVAAARRDNLDFLNPWPFFVNVGFWERLLQPLLWGMVRLRFPLVWVNQHWAKENMAFGPMILIRKSAYDAVDGHRHVAMDILEDVALAKLMRARGFRTNVVNGRPIVRVRMYENLRQLLDGWTKTAFGAMNYNLFWMGLAIAGIFWAASQPFVTLAWGLASGNSTWAVAGGFQIAAIFVRRMVDKWENGFDSMSILLHPFGMVMVHYMQLRAVYKYYFGAYNWKERAYVKPKSAQSPDASPRESQTPVDSNL